MQETYEMLTVMFGESTMSRIQVQLWCNRFKKGQEDVNDDAHPCGPNSSTTNENIEAMEKMILDNCWNADREVADDVDICSTHVKQFLRILLARHWYWQWRLAIGEFTISRTQVQLWYKEGRENINDYVLSGCPCTPTTNENIEAVKKMILDNRRITIREIANYVGISFGSCQAFVRMY